jgi:hypothetical protein
MWDSRHRLTSLSQLRIEVSYSSSVQRPNDILDVTGVSVNLFGEVRLRG